MDLEAILPFPGGQCRVVRHENASFKAEQASIYVESIARQSARYSGSRKIVPTIVNRLLLIRIPFAYLADYPERSLECGTIEPIRLRNSRFAPVKCVESHDDDNNNMESKMKSNVMKFLRDEEGLTIVEYAVAAGLISALVVAAFTNLGNRVLQIINGLITALGGTP